MEIVALVLAAFLQFATLSLDQLRETIKALKTALTAQYVEAAQGASPAGGRLTGAAPVDGARPDREGPAREARDVASGIARHRVEAQPKRVEEASFVTIGGIDQWVTVRADDGRKPVLLLLHGGPGDVQSPFVSTYAPYEKDFVLVQWDQRGAGRTFAKNGTAALTRETLIADGIELAERLRQRFPGAPLILFGHSWGSIVATGMAQQRPDLFAAYVGTGQVTAWADLVQFQFEFLKRRYTEQGDRTALAALEAIGTPDPKNVTQYFAFSRPIRQNMNDSDTAWLNGLKGLFIANGGTETALKEIGDGMSASGRALIEASVATDLPAAATRFEMPYSVIQGRHDRFAPTPLAEAYFNQVSAPRKRLTVIESAGHFALATHQADVIAALKDALPQK